ncbi:hypothetical protein GCM10007067_11620 [Lysobacter bugurensis]|uniref:Uncharacterized protein n=1 Tax=Cognatilysobacter bugurensis TaxID=543356 RepID=A0A918SWP5_9GAMM|nr:hypothetical protein GCM10007067_11620 [Lysobacter bugurensis]
MRNTEEMGDMSVPSGAEQGAGRYDRCDPASSCSAHRAIRSTPQCMQGKTPVWGRMARVQQVRRLTRVGCASRAREAR